ncbi:hypothetical protein MC885_001288 [Smutsia gigantea]|nr:hypothetical protein MC885_001288 [Smutsia gigantea]
MQEKNSPIEKDREVIQNSKEVLGLLQEKNPTFKPVLAVIQAGGDNLMQEINQNLAEEAGLNITCICLPPDSGEDEIIDEILKINEDSRVHGLALQISESSFSNKVLNALKPEKDVDGVTDINLGKLVRGDAHECFISPVARAVTELLEKCQLRWKEDLGNRSSWVFGSRHTMSVPEKRVHDNELPLQEADIVVLGSPKPEEIPLSWIQPGTTVLNCSHDFLSGKHGCGSSPGTQFSGLIAEEDNMVSSGKRWLREQQYSRWRLHCLKLQPLSPVPSDIEISRAQTPKAVDVLAKEIGLLADEIEIYGRSKAKVHLSLLERLKDQADGKYILVAGITPTPLGEGKSTVTIGLVQALTAHLNINSFACLRQPSQGPTFGVKGGAAGGGYAQVIPMEEALYNRLVPLVNGSREFSKIQLARLKKLGINKTDPNSLTEEEINKFARLCIDPSTVTWQRGRRSSPAGRMAYNQESPRCSFYFSPSSSQSA